jgi:hypothetical protein
LLIALTVVAGGTLGSAIHVLRAVTRAVPANMLGICTGMPSAVTGGPQTLPLTPWLHDRIQAAAGRSPGDPPLCFSDLDAAGITVRMVTSNLAQNRPFELPFVNNWVFKREEFVRLFPPDIVEWLVAHAHASDTVHLPDGFHFLPEAPSLPLVVAARFSLSFPVLFSAIPLYSISRAAFTAPHAGRAVSIAAEQLQRNWFSDGGISSNFPVHFFDRWLPARPTFGINLSELPRNAVANGRIDDRYLDSRRGAQDDTREGPTVDDAVRLPRANRPLGAEWSPLGPTEFGQAAGAGAGAVPSLFRFATSIFVTAQSYRDTMQSELAGYRDRIVQIRLAEGEGGLNLATSEKALASMKAKGDRAGLLLLEQFRFPEHQWVRLRTLFALLAAELDRLAPMLAGQLVPSLFTQQLAARSTPQQFAYARDAAWCAKAAAALEQLHALADQWHGSVFRDEPPKADSVLRVTPRI